MALKPKSGSLRIRIDPELLEAFRSICARRGMTVSDGLRRFMEDRVGMAYHSAKQSQGGVEKLMATIPPELVEKPPARVPIDPEGYVLPRQTRAERRKAERDAKKNSYAT